MNERSQKIQKMFSDIASHYDLLNRIMTFGMDVFLRRIVVRQLKPVPGQLFLDDGAGTGDLSFEILTHVPAAKVIAVDFTFAMLKHARERDSQAHIQWVLADAQNLPFAPATFNGVVSGFLLRNVTQIHVTLNEQFRVLKHNGVSVSLDTTPPSRNILRPLILLYLRFIIPFLGLIFAKNPSAYTYLPETTEHFLNPVQLRGVLEKAGFSSVSWKTYLVGTTAIHRAEKK